MTRKELIQAITEGKYRRASTHWHGGPALAGSTAGGAVGVTLKQKYPKGAEFAGAAGQAAGLVHSVDAMGKDVKRLDTTKGGKKAKAEAGARFAKRNPMSGGFVLPRNERERKKLAKRGTVGHIGHGALRFLGGGPWNVGRYATKVSYARSGFHRKNAPMRREDIEEAIVKKAFG